MKPINKLLRDLRNVDETTAASRFTELFRRGLDLLDLKQKADIVRVFNINLGTARRWYQGKEVPRGAAAYLEFLRREVEGRGRCLGKERGE